MARPTLEIGTHGKITVKRQPNGSWRAITRFRDYDGVVRQPQGFGPTAAKAEAALKRALRDRVAAAGEGEITRDTKLSELLDLWLDELVVEGNVTRQTIDLYRSEIDESDDARAKTATVTIKKAIGNLRIRECTTSRIDRYLKGLRATPAKAKRQKVILSGALGMACRHDALPENPVREVARIRRQAADVRALDVDGLVALREHIRLWVEGEGAGGTSVRRMGPKRDRVLLDLLDLLVATGARPGELLAVRWRDIDFAAEPVRLTIGATVVRLQGVGLVRQPFTKSKKPRVVQLPAFAVAVLMRMKVEAVSNEWDLVFPSRAGSMRDPHNLNRTWREARGDRWAWVTAKTFRKAVATLVERECGAEAAAAQLGHSGTEVTKKYYIERPDEAPNLTDVLGRFSG